MIFEKEEKAIYSKLKNLFDGKSAKLSELKEIIGRKCKNL
jgi:hypothetical protein